MPSSAATLAALRPLLRQNWSASCLYSSVYLALLRAGLLNCVFMWALLGFLTLSPLSVKLGQPYTDPYRSKTLSCKKAQNLGGVASARAFSHLSPFYYRPHRFQSGSREINFGSS